MSTSALTTHTLVLLLGSPAHWSSYQPLMMNLPDELAHSNVTTILAGGAADRVTFVVTLGLACLASVPASVVALIDSSSRQMRSNLDQHESEYPPGKPWVVTVFLLRLSLASSPRCAISCELQRRHMVSGSGNVRCIGVCDVVFVRPLHFTPVPRRQRSSNLSIPPHPTRSPYGLPPTTQQGE